jgi:hypothetical protein
MPTKQTTVLETNAASVSPYRYVVYGVTLHSDLQLGLPTHGFGELGQIHLRTAPASFFSHAQRELSPEPDAGSWHTFGRLSDHSSYVRWEGVGEFLVSARGHQITARQFEEASRESFQVYLLGQALSFALVKSGFEPLHATTVVINGEAVAFLGESGMGKSTLAACFLEAGYAMLTDDLLVVRKGAVKKDAVGKDASVFMAYAGPPRIKLYPELASRFLGASNGIAMNTEAQKLILPLDANRVSDGPIPLKALYTLAVQTQASRKQSVRITVLPPRESFMALVKNTFNYRIVNSARLERQFKQTAQLVSTIPVKKVSYPRVLSQLPALRDAILADLNSADEKQAACAD